MKEVLACVVGIALGSAAIAACAESANTAPAASKPKPSATATTSPKPSRAERLTDAQLDAVTAGTADIVRLPGILIISNPGNADQLKFLHNRILIIND
jgi:hypothetical protein